VQKSFLFPGCGARRWRGADFILLVKWRCAPRGPEAELVFSLSWFSRWWRRAGFFFELVLALVARGMFSLLVKRLALRAGQR